MQPEQATESTNPSDNADAADDTDTEQVDDAGTDEPTDSEPETFPRAYVEELRQENGKYRQRVQQADTYAHRLHNELVRATGKLADPTDIPFDETHLDDPDALTAAVDDLLARKPHLASRRPVGDIGQGTQSAAASSIDLAAILRQRAQ